LRFNPSAYWGLPQADVKRFGKPDAGTDLPSESRSQRHLQTRSEWWDEIDDANKKTIS
jgi:hypothetical protein